MFIQVRLAQIASEGLKSSRKLGSHKAPCHKLTILKDQPQIILSAGEDCVVLNHDLRNSKAEKYDSQNIFLIQTNFITLLLVAF